MDDQLNEQQVRSIIQDELQKYSTKNMYGMSNIPAHPHDGVAGQQIDFTNLTNRSRFILYRIVAPATSVSVAIAVGGNFTMPIGGNFVSAGFTVDTAGTTGTMVVNFLLNGTTILNSATITALASGSLTTRNNNLQNFAINNFKLGDIVTFNVTTIHSTPALGLTVFIRVTETT